MSKLVGTRIVLFWILLMTTLTCMYIFSEPVFMDTDSVSRGFDSLPRLWMNGYLGYILSFKNFGWVPAAGFSFAIFYAGKGIKIDMSNRFLIYFLLFGMMLFITWFAHINYRYHQTLLILLFPSLIYGLKNIQPDESRRVAIRLMLLISVIGFFISFFGFLLPKYSTRIHQLNVNHHVDTKMESGEGFWIGLNKIVKNDTVLCNNLPEFYINSSCYGIFFWCGSFDYYIGSGKKTLPSDLEPVHLAKHFYNQLGVRYILSSPMLNSYNESFKRLCNDFCSPVLFGPDDLVLYKLNPKQLSALSYKISPGF